MPPDCQLLSARFEYNKKIESMRVPPETFLGWAIDMTNSQMAHFFPEEITNIELITKTFWKRGHITGLRLERLMNLWYEELLEIVEDSLYAVINHRGVTLVWIANKKITWSNDTKGSCLLQIVWHISAYKINYLH
ncbi:hypothetical protein ACJX0J_010670 [Zea mays]